MQNMMNTNKKYEQAKQTLLFICILLLGGVCHVIDVIIHRADDLFTSTWMFCADLMIYSGLILFWLQSVRQRLLPSRARSYLLASGGLMLLFLMLRTVKYRIVQWSTPLERYCWYGYYVPIILVPTFFLMTAFYFGNKPAQQSRFKRYPLILGLILTLGILTNDLHSLAFKFKPNPITNAFYGEYGTYTHGFLFYAAYIWAGCMITGGILYLIAVTRKMKDWKAAVRPLLCMLLFLPMTFLNNRLVAAGLPQPFLMPEVLIFCLIGVLEFSIRNHLLPHNEYYDAFFSKLDLPVSITDKAFEPVYQTPMSVAADKAQMQQAVGSFVYPDPDTRISGLTLSAGYAFFAEDESNLHRLNEELRDANEVLSLENELLTREQELRKEKAAIEERNALYAKAALEIYPAQKRISALLEKAVPDTPAFRMDMARILFMTAYVKRKANFVMLEADHGAISAEELSAAFNESIHYLSYCGIHTAARITAGNSIPFRKAMAVYDCFETAAEALYGKTEEIWVRLTDTELMIMADTADALSLPEMPLPAVCSYADGQTVIRVQTGGDAQ